MQRLPNNTEAARATGCLTSNATGPLLLTISLILRERLRIAQT